MEKLNWVEKMNDFGDKGRRFIFIIDFEMQQPMVYSLDNIPDDIYYKFNAIKNYSVASTSSLRELEFRKTPISLKQYGRSFDQVAQEIQAGNSFLLNLTFPTKIESNYSLLELFKVSLAKYKLYFRSHTFLYEDQLSHTLVNR